MTLWLIVPRDPLIFRDGRPFSADPGARATTLPFPFPSTLAGAARTLSMAGSPGTRFDDRLVEALLQKTIRGPLLVEPTEVGVKAPFVPAPADALILRRADGEQTGATCQWLRPLTLSDGAQTNLPPGLLPTGPRRVHKGKPQPEAPAFWNWKKFEAWLIEPQDEAPTGDLASLGIGALPRDSRVHVRMNPALQTADPGGLFQTSGLEFVLPGKGEGGKAMAQARELALIIDTDADVSESLGFLGGERRVAQWRKSDAQLPGCPEAVRKHIVAEKACRLILLTPAHFEAGWQPEWVLTACGATAHVVAASVPRAQTVSGWDYKDRKPKPTRRLAPAGSVFYLKLEGDEKALQTFVDQVWMQNVSDGDQDRRDGFGLAALGTWDGNPVSMEVDHG